MEKINYPHLNEILYVEKLTNGLTIRILPKPGFQKTYAVFSTRYGSVDNHFQLSDGTEKTVPDGIAHFLEHKMFEEPEGDVFSRFADQGASANAFTSFDRTSYLFSATDHIEDNILTLLNFVQNPYFTDENVAKEKGIIGQEINMYRDHPDWRVYYGLIESMYSQHPIHIDIAGTIDSIAKIDKEMLYACHETFYHPGNMTFFVVGGVDPEKIIKLIRDNQEQKTFSTYTEVSRIFPDEPNEVQEKQRINKLPVSLPKCLFGFKEKVTYMDPEEVLYRELSTKLLFDLLFSPSSEVYQTLYDENLITDQFGYEYQANTQYAFSVIGGESRDPDLLLARIKELVLPLMVNGFDQASFDRCKKKRIGNYLRVLNSPEAIANEYTKYSFKHIDFFRFLSVYEGLTLTDMNERLRDHVEWEQMAVSIVRNDTA
jgi:predicted Zn-dependent peptidase